MDPSTCREYLFINVMKRDWQEVITIYKQYPTAHTTKITRSEDTALHMAISDGQESIVEELVQIVDKTALETKNNLGNTPLHLAAYEGSVRMCKCIASRDLELVGILNKSNETPFFRAVVHGRKDAFLCMHQYLCKEVDQGYRYCRRNDGWTILHSAIAGEHFDLAFQIIHLYPKLIHSVDEMGLSPLHILASKPSAFRSGSNIRGFHKFIYRCVPVSKLKYSQTSVRLVHQLRNITRASMGHSIQELDAEDPNGEQLDQEQVGSSKIYRSKGQGPHDFFVPNCFRTGLKSIFGKMRDILSLRYSIHIPKIREEKEKHTWSLQIMKKLLDISSSYEYESGGNPYLLPTGEYRETAPYAFGYFDVAHFNPMILITDYHELVDEMLDDEEEVEIKKTETPLLIAAKHGIIEMVENKEEVEIKKTETPLLIAAKHGIMEMVEKILEIFPVAIHDINIEGKNIVLLAVENRQPHVYQFLLGQGKTTKETIFYKTDKDGNTALHLAAVMGDHRPLGIPGPALQMQWEIKWYEFVKNSMPFNFFARHNRERKTPSDIFMEKHQSLVERAGEWLKSTSESCSVVATLIATVAFAASTTIPGGVKSESGIPSLEKEPAFCIFAIASLIALCFSVSSVMIFLAFLNSSYHEEDFNLVMPGKLLRGLTTLFVSLASMLVSFCAAHYLIMRDRLKYAAFPVYVVIFLLVTSYAVAQFPWYIDVAWTTFSNIPQRCRSRQFS